KEVVRPFKYDHPRKHNDKSRTKEQQRTRRRVNWADETAQSKKNLAKSHENNDEHALEEKVKLFFEWVDRQDFSKVPMEDKVHCGGRKMRGRR
ncbi:MAG: hypothetical protein LQ343_007233, partial [Gyalolechia ehrenbergii]